MYGVQYVLQCTSTRTLHPASLIWTDRTQARSAHTFVDQIGDGRRTANLNGRGRDRTCGWFLGELGYGGPLALWTVYGVAELLWCRLAAGVQGAGCAVADSESPFQDLCLDPWDTACTLDTGPSVY